MLSQPAERKFELDYRADLSTAYWKIIESMARSLWSEFDRSAGL
jgi:hypothetical protein